ncbi:hypothetical protein EMIT0P44_370004 [Pseudomonas sp. IT-P44]
MRLISRHRRCRRFCMLAWRKCDHPQTIRLGLIAVQARVSPLGFVCKPLPSFRHSQAE